MNLHLAHTLVSYYNCTSHGFLVFEKSHLIYLLFMTLCCLFFLNCFQNFQGKVQGGACQQGWRETFENVFTIDVIVKANSTRSRSMENSINEQLLIVVRRMESREEKEKT